MANLLSRIITGARRTFTVETRYEEKTDVDNVPPLPEALEQRIKIIKVRQGTSFFEWRLENM